MKWVILLIIFSYTLVLNVYHIFGQENISETSACPFTLFHLIKEANRDIWEFQETFNSINLLLEYGTDPNPDLERECFDSYYQSLPKGSTLLHILSYSSISSLQKFVIYNLMIEYGTVLTSDEYGHIFTCQNNTFNRSFDCKIGPVTPSKVNAQNRE